MSVLYYGFIFVLSQIPGHVIAQVGFSIWDKAAHFMVYSLMGFFWGTAFLYRLGVKRKWRIFVIAIVLSSVLGALDEIHQLFVEGRFASLGDWAADSLGGLLGGAIATCCIPYRMAVWNHFSISRPMKRKKAS